MASKDGLRTLRNKLVAPSRAVRGAPNHNHLQCTNALYVCTSVLEANKLGNVTHGHNFFQPCYYKTRRLRTEFCDGVRTNFNREYKPIPSHVKYFYKIY
jgi:hypothetical protein